MPDLRFTLGAVLATALLAVTALGVAATLRLAQHVRLGPLQNSSSLAYSDASDWNQFTDPTAARRFDELMRPVEGVSMPVSETAIADVPAPTAPSALPQTSALDVTNAATATNLTASAPREPSATPEMPPAITVSSQAAAEPLPSIAPEADTKLSQGAVAAAPQGAVLATPPAQSPEVVASAAPEALQCELPPDSMTTASIDAPTLPPPATTAALETGATASTAAASPVERASAVANVAVPEQPAMLTSDVPTAPALIEPLTVVTPIVAPQPAAGVERVASLPTALRGIQVTSAPFPPLPRAAPHRRFGKAAPQAHNAARRYSIVRRVRTLRTAQVQRVQPAPSPFGPMNFTATTAQSSDLFSPAAATKASRKRTEINASATYSDDPVSRTLSPNTFGR